MDPADFNSDSPGRLIPIQHGMHAFLPDPLPASAKFPQQLWPLLAEAKSRIGLLEGIGRTLPNPGLLLRPLEDREAIKSSRLEGTYVTARELLLFEMEPRDPKPGENEVNDWREVSNYRQALHHGVSSELPLSLRLIRDLHRILMTGVRGKDKTPGEFRKHQVAIGRNHRFVPPPQTHLAECLEAFEKYIHQSSEFDPLIECFLCHYQFETIHPFHDGNGRIGRLLMALMMQRRCGLTKPWLYLSEYFERHREEYYDCLYNVSAKSAWCDWIEFCLKATIQQTDSTVNRCEQLRSVREEFASKLTDAGGSIRLNQIIEYLFVSPFIRVADLPEKLGVTYPTAKADVLRLEQVGILSLLPNATPTTYYAHDVFRVAYEDMETFD